MQVLMAMLAGLRCQAGLRVITVASVPSSTVILKPEYSVHQEHVSHHDMPVNMENPYKEPPKRCTLCNVSIDYKNTQLLSQFVSPYTGRIYGRHITGLCGRKQRQISRAIKMAHTMGFMPVTYKDPAFLNDPKVCDIRSID